MPDLNSGFPGMTFSAEALEISQSKTQFGMGPHGQDVIHFQKAALATLDALPAVAVQRLQPHGLPAWRTADLGAVIGIVPALHAHAMRPPRCLGRARRRAPSATASTVAAAASIRPRERDLASL